MYSKWDNGRECILETMEHLSKILKYGLTDTWANVPVKNHHLDLKNAVLPKEVLLMMPFLFDFMTYQNVKTREGFMAKVNQGAAVERVCELAVDLGIDR